jgi:hypothetical protein
MLIRAWCLLKQQRLGGLVSNAMWAAVSERDLLVDQWFTRELHRVRDRRDACGLLVLFGGRGSGKSSLLARLERRAENTYHARLDCEQLGQQVHGTVDVLARVVFQLRAELPTMPPLQLPAYAAMRLALAVETDPADRETALREMSAALEEGKGQERSVDLFVDLVEKVGAAAGLPALGLAALPFLAELLKNWQLRRIRRTLQRQVGTQVSAADFLVSVGHGFQYGDDAQRQYAEDVLMRAFLDDLRYAYTTEEHWEQRTLRCLVLLDNADDERGQKFLAALGKARHRDEGMVADPLLVMATARSRPQVLEEAVAPVGSGLSRCWRQGPEPRGPEPRQELFVPLPARAGSRTGVARLRMLSRSEVRERCGSVVAALPQVPGVQRVDAWLARVLHEMTGGHPSATAAALRELPRFEEEVPVVTRLRQIFAPHGPNSVVEEAYEQCFGDLSAGVGNRLRRVAAAAVPHQALSAERLLGPGFFLVEQVMDVLDDDLRVDVAQIDGRSVLVLPVIARRRLLYKLARDEETAEPGTWVGAHRILRESLEARDAAYHDLALGDVPAATRFLHDLFQRVRQGEAELDSWCRALSWIQKAPHPRLGTFGDGVQEYHDTVARVTGDLPADQMPMARLLIAGQLTLHPPADPYDGLWCDPLWDPTARLRGEIAEQLYHLRELLGYRRGLPLHDRVQSYEKEPWS